MKVLKHLPNALTSANLICGCLGIISVFNYPVEAAYFVWAACFFDFLDGFAARFLKQSSPIGKQLDSLADMVSFGVLPAMTMYMWLESSETESWMSYGAIIITLFSALRLAKFNVDENQSDSFIGIPTPANALFITSLVFLPEPIRSLVFDGTSLLIITIAFSLLMVAPVKLIALKFKNFGWFGNETKFTFLIISVFLLGFLQAGAIPFIILSYIVISLVSGALGAKKK
ncbi:MAG: CDP-diacylglycerol--serine O-phosphatidyltransferase [Cyclobacteriaceae bacterium]|nr:CDP-diacylglycerol--serine O-phosphatidyltransferase [Cyclobacteriaceae bacterium]